MYRWCHTFNADDPIADLVSLGWVSTTEASTPSNVTTPAALSAPSGGEPGDTHVLTCTALQRVLLPQYLDLGAGEIDRGIICFRLKWVSGEVLFDRRIFSILGTGGAELALVKTRFAGFGTRLMIGDVEGSTGLVQGGTYAIAIAYDYAVATPTIRVYLDGQLEIDATDSAPATVSRFELSAPGNTALMAYNTLRWYDDPTGDLAIARSVNVWMLHREVESIDSIDAGWSQVGSPASDLKAIQSDLSTGLDRPDSDEGSMVVSFEEPTDLWGGSILAVSVICIGTSSDLLPIVQIDDGDGEAVFDLAKTVGTVFSLVTVATNDSSGAAWELGGSEGSATLDYSSTLTVGSYAPWIPTYPLAGTGLVVV